MNNPRFISVKDRVPEHNALCEIYYDIDKSCRKVRFISTDGLNGAPLWTNEKGTVVVHPVMSGWCYIYTDPLERINEIEAWLSTLPLEED